MGSKGECKVLYPGMHVYANLLKTKLITMRKSTNCPEYPPPSFDPAYRMAELGDQATAPSGHRGFREKYFAGFKKIGDSSN